VSLSVAVVLLPSQPPALTSRRPNKKAALEVRECVLLETAALLRGSSVEP